MTVQAYQFAGGYGVVAVPNATIVSLRDPTSTDTISPAGNPYTPGQYWENETTGILFVYLGGGNWTPVSGSGITSITQIDGNAGSATPIAGIVNIIGAAGVTTSGAGDTLTISLSGGGIAIDSFVPDAGTNPVVPSGTGSVTMAGTANQITTTGGLNTLTFSVPTTFIAPGSIASTTTITSGTGITSTLGNIVASAGNITATLGSMSAGTSITAGTTITATLGNITTTNGNFVASTAGTGLILPVGTASGATPQIVNARVGSVTFTGISIAAAADLTLVLTNSTITGAGTRLMLSMIGATTGSAISIKSYTSSSGSCSIVVTNGTGATTTTADITFDFIVLN